MTPTQTASTLITWTNSCINRDQCALVNECIDQFLIERFKGDPSVAHEVSRVLMALQDKCVTFGL